jgi:RNA polymerase sigma-70 factor (ECF subfamily)
MSSLSEDDNLRRLRERLAEGDAAAFAEAYDLFGPRLYRAAARMLGRADEAEDAVQELFVSLVRSRAHLPGVENLTAYLFVSLRRLIARTADQRSRRPRLHEGRLDDAASRSPAREARELREELDAALRALPLEQREVVTLKMDGELTFAEIAAVLNVSPNTVASRHRYALEKLRTLLADEAPRRAELPARND